MTSRGRRAAWGTVEAEELALEGFTPSMLRPEPAGETDGTYLVNDVCISMLF